MYIERGKCVSVGPWQVSLPPSLPFLSLWRTVSVIICVCRCLCMYHTYVCMYQCMYLQESQASRLEFVVPLQKAPKVEKNAINSAYIPSSVVHVERGAIGGELVGGLTTRKTKHRCMSI